MNINKLSGSFNCAINALQLPPLDRLLMAQRHVLPKRVRIFQLLRAYRAGLRLLRVHESYVLLQPFHCYQNAARKSN